MKERQRLPRNSPRHEGRRRRINLSVKVFEELKVAAFCWGIAGPLMIKYLAEHGATAVRIESEKRIDMVR